jgi:predicted DNA-binding transcriptional regulator AlpA
MTEKQVVNWKALKALGIPYSRAHVWRLMRQGLFPRCFKLGAYSNSPPVWWLHEIAEWLEEKSKAKLDMQAPE